MQFFIGDPFLDTVVILSAPGVKGALASSRTVCHAWCVAGPSELGKGTFVKAVLERL